MGFGILFYTKGMDVGGRPAGAALYRSPVALRATAFGVLPIAATETGSLPVSTKPAPQKTPLQRRSNLGRRKAFCPCFFSTPFPKQYQRQARPKIKPYSIHAF